MMASSREEKARNAKEKYDESQRASEGLASESSDEEEATRLAVEMRRKVNLDFSDVRSQDL